jgi:hypothetical protein
LNHAEKQAASAVFATILPEPFDEFSQSGFDSRPGAVSKLLDGLGYVGVGALDVARLSGKEFSDGLFTEGIFDSDDQIIDCYRS